MLGSSVSSEFDVSGSRPPFDEHYYSRIEAGHFDQQPYYPTTSHPLVNGIVPLSAVPGEK